jgi:hypothetical protein
MLLHCEYRLHTCITTDLKTEQQLFCFLCFSIFHLTVCTISLLPTSLLTVLALLWAPHISPSYLIHHTVPSLCFIQNHQHPYWLPVNYQVLQSTTSNSAPFRATSVLPRPSRTFPDWLTYFYSYCHHTTKALPNTDTLHPTIQGTNELI